MTKQTETRRAAIVSQLSDLSKDGWSKARPADYQPLEAELRAIDQASAPAASSSGPRSYAFYIQEKRSPRGKFTMGNNPHPFRTAAEAFAMLDDLNEHGGCGPLRVVDQSLRLIERPIGLTWSIDDRGNHIAQAMRKYSVAYESTSAGGRYQVRVDGYPIGQAPTEAEAKAIAQAHHDRPAA